MRDIFLPVLPSLYARWERVLKHRPKSFLRLGSWIGGDRDGNPNVTADSLQLRAGARGADGAGRLPGAAACDGRRAVDLQRAGVGRPRRWTGWPRKAATTTRRARDEPYRRAITGCYARLAATYKNLTGRAPPRPASVAGEPYPDAESLRSDLLALEQSLETSSRGWLGRGGALSRLIRAVETFGFHLATLDLRQNVGRARARGHGAAAGRRGRGRLPGAGGGRAGRTAAPRAGRRATAGQSIRQLQRRDAVGARHRARRGHARTRCTARRASPPTSCPNATACPICSRSTFCSRRPACTADTARGAPRSWWCRCLKPSPI